MLRRLRFAIPLLVSLAGCQLLFQSPQLTLTDLRMSGVGLGGTTLTAFLTVRNPNLFDVTTVRITYELVVEDKPAGKGVYDTPFTVPGRGEVPLEFPMQLGWGAALGGLGSAFGKGEINSVTRGVVTTRFFFGDLDVPYEIRSRIADPEKDKAPPP
ncbi:MAG: LEA type 2 family protein [Deltaproteobacteria bacterium]|nr:LEA type 2 family protein [Deltaproteobacteria bacterium]